MPSKYGYAITGLGLLTESGGMSGRTLQAEAARLAIDDAGLKPSQVNGAINLKLASGSSERPDYTDAFPRVLGLPVNFYYTIGRGGSLGGLGIASALKFLDLGIADYIVLVHATEDYSNSRKSKEAGEPGNVYVDKKGYYGRPFGDLRAVSHHTFFAARHMYEFGTKSEDFGSIAVQLRQWACLNPGAKLYGKPITIEDYLHSPLVVWPYRLFDMCVIADGAVAVILTTADRAKDAPQKPVYVMGIGFGEAMAELWWEKKNYTKLAVRPAREAAFRQAGITLADIDMAQLYDCFTGEILLQIEDYGWCGKGEGGAFIREKGIGPGGNIPVNTGGGMLAAYHYGDMTGVSEAVLQLRGEAGARQVEGAKTCLVSGHGGEILSPGMCSFHSTLLLGGEEYAG